MQAHEVIKHEYGNSANFMTPTVLEIGWLKPGEFAYELSSGKFMDDKLWGVSIVKVVTDKPLTTQRMTDLSGMFHSLDAARNRINELTNVE